MVKEVGFGAVDPFSLGPMRLLLFLPIAHIMLATCISVLHWLGTTMTLLSRGIVDIVGIGKPGEGRGHDAFEGAEEGGGAGEGRSRETCGCARV